MRFLAFLLAAVLTSCGGGGGSTPATPRAVHAHACYFGMSSTDVIATMDHADCVDAGPWQPADQLAALTFAEAQQRPTILMSPDVCNLAIPVDQVRGIIEAWLDMLQVAHHLDRLVIAGVRPCDEPKGSDADVRARITAVHAALAKYPATTAARIAIFYPCSATTFPGLAFVDLPGCDAYDWTPDQIFTVYRDSFEPLANAEPDIKLILIAGGSDPWRADPTRYVDKVLGDGRYWGLEGFGYGPLDVFPNGVSTNGLRPLWAAQLRRITQ